MNFQYIGRDELQIVRDSFPAREGIIIGFSDPSAEKRQCKEGQLPASSEMLFPGKYATSRLSHSPSAAITFVLQIYSSWTPTAIVAAVASSAPCAPALGTGQAFRRRHRVENRKVGVAAAPEAPKCPA